MFFGVSAKRKTGQPRLSGGGFSFFRPPTSGIKVDDNTAFTYSGFYSCMRIISETIAYLPWHVMVAGTKRQIARDNPLDNILFMRPNEEMNSFTFRELMLQHALGWGNAYAEIERNRSGDIVNLWPLDPARVEPKRDANGRLYYEVINHEDLNVDLKPRDVFHLRGPSRDGIKGYSVIELAAESISLGLASEAFGAGFFGNGAIPGTVIKNSGQSKIGPEGVKNLLKTFNKKNQGSRQAFKTEYLDPGLEIEVIGISPESAQFLETRKFQISEIARWFRIPPHKLADLERSTHTNIEAQNIEFVTDAIMPWVSRIENQGNFSLIRNPSQFYNKINVLGVLRGDSKARSEYYRILASLGVLSIDEIREKEDMDSIGEAGDLRLVPLNMVTPERAKSGEASKENRVNNAANAIIRETAQRFSKIEIARAKKLSERQDKQAIADFYVSHARSLFDGFNNVSTLVCEDSQRKDNTLQQFFGDYITQSADQLQNAMESEQLNALFCSWEARKADNMARDLITRLSEAA